MSQHTDLNLVLGEALAAFQRSDYARAEVLCNEVLKHVPEEYNSLHLLGIVNLKTRRLPEALAYLDRAVNAQPQSFEAYSNRGSVLKELGRHEEALASFERAIALRPDFTGALYNRGNVLKELARYSEALASYDKAIALNPNYTDAFSNRGLALHALGRYDEALQSYDKAIALRPDHADAFNNRGIAFYELGRFAEARESFRSAVRFRPDFSQAFGDMANANARMCDWTEWPQIQRQLLDYVRAGAVIEAFTFLNFCGAPADQLACAKRYSEYLVPLAPAPLYSGRDYATDKIRIGYVSADFHEHATAYLMAELFESHDRSRFEIFGFSFGPDDRSSMRRRLEKAFDRFFDVWAESPEQTARRIRELGIGIAVDLKGYTNFARPRIFAHRPAPVQVNYLGYPGTMGAGFIDYVLVDPFVAPASQQPFFAEKLVHLPDCYQVNDSKREIAGRIPPRDACGLPEQGFVFCSFNNNYKINPEIFDIWMRLLRAVPGSVLWLLGDNETAEANLRREAVQRGIDPGRLVFAPRLPLAEHLARHRIADLFLDTLPYNAHTTASDALWAGLPVLTCAGAAFASRVAGSLLHAMGLPELVTRSLDEYEALAIKLAGDPGLLSDLRAKLASNRLAAPLFDTGRFRRHIESAYAKMWEIYLSGAPPKSFAVDPLPRP